jgi:hypothetical protein
MMLAEIYTDRGGSISNTASMGAPCGGERESEEVSTGGFLSTSTFDQAFERKKDILFHVTLNPGRDACEVAQALGIPSLEAVLLVQDMLRSGLLDFAD